LARNWFSRKRSKIEMQRPLLVGEEQEEHRRGGLGLRSCTKSATGRAFGEGRCKSTSSFNQRFSSPVETFRFRALGDMIDQEYNFSVRSPVLPRGR